MDNRVEWLDGMRGWAALAVFFCHFYKCWLFPPCETALGFLVYKTPLHLCVDGSSAISLFFVLSGFALSYRFFITRSFAYLMESAQFRYFRLVIPIFFCLIPVYCFMKLGLFVYHKFAYNAEISFTLLLKYCFFDLLLSDTADHGRYGPALWTLRVEFLGSMMIFSFLSLFGLWKLRAGLYILLMYVSFNMKGVSGFYFLFLMGVIICDLYTLFLKQPSFFSWLISSFPNSKLSSLFLRFKPSASRSIQFKIAKIAINLFTIFIFFKLYYNVVMLDYKTFLNDGAFFCMIFLVILTLLNPILKWFFSSSVSVFLGRISFSLYLIHFPVIASLSAYTRKLLIDFGYTEKFVLVAVSLVTIPITICISYVFSVFVEGKSLKIVKTFFRKNANRQNVSLSELKFVPSPTAQEKNKILKTA